MHSFLGCPNFYESLEGSPQIFRHCEIKTIDRIVIPYYPKAFRHHEISETQGSHFRNFSVLWDKKDQQNRDTRIIQNILIPECCWNTDGFAHDDFWRCETKKLDKFVITLLSKNFWYQNISETQKGSPTMFFGDLGQKNFDAKTWHPPSYP